MDKIGTLILATKINDQVVDNSTILENKAKEAFNQLSNYIRDFLNQEQKLNAFAIDSLKNNLLTYWNESINPDTEMFWAEMKVNKIEYERKEPLRYALSKNHFRNVDQGIEARKYWIELKNLKEIKHRFTTAEIKQLDDIILKDERQRLEILKKCLRKKQITLTQYLKFGECMAYMNNCGLWEINFTKVEVDELHDIWKNFQIK